MIKNILENAKKEKDNHNFKAALNLLSTIDKDHQIDKSSKEYIDFLHLKAQCYYQNNELPLRLRCSESLKIIGELSDDESSRLKGAIYKRKYFSERNLSDLYLSIKYYEEVSHNPADDLGYGAVNTIFLYYVLIHDIGGSLANDLKNVYITKIRDLGEFTRNNLIENYETFKNGENDNKEWLEPTIAELSLALMDFSTCKTYLQKSFSPSSINAPLNRQEYVCLEQMIRVYDLLPVESSMDLSELFQGVFHGKKLQIESIIASVRIGKVGLALSGGGFRASLFHIGVLHRLAELDILRHVQVISSVSGGSIIAMHYYLKLKHLLEHNDNFSLGKEAFIGLVREVEKEFIEGIQTNIRMHAFVESNGELTETLGHLYEKQLFARTGDVPDSMNKLYICPMLGGEAQKSFKPHINNFELKNKVPILIINATSLNNGHNWRFTASGMGEVPHMYDMTVDKNKIYEYTRYEDFSSGFQKVSIGKAVAASSAVPALFDPINMGNLYGNGDTIRLSDGGVYDNQGIAALVSEECEIMITSDASKQLREEDNPSDFRFDVLGRVQDILMNKTRDSEFKLAKELRRANRVKGLAILHLKDGFSNEVVHARAHNPDIMENLVTKKDIREKLANIRTDLDAFHDLEAQALIQSGYEITAHWFETYGKDQEEWKYFDRDAKKEVHFGKLNETIQDYKEESLRILGISSNILFKYLRIVKWSTFRIKVSICLVGIFLLYWVCILLKLLIVLMPKVVVDGLILWSIFFIVFSVIEIYLIEHGIKTFLNKIIYVLLRPISIFYLKIFNQKYLDKGKL